MRKSIIGMNYTIKGNERCEEDIEGSEGTRELRRVSKGFKGFRRVSKGFNGASHDSYPPFKVVSTRHDGSARRERGRRARSECDQS